MTKYAISVTIEGEILDAIEELQEKIYKGASRSYVIEQLLKQALKEKADISVSQ